MTLKFKILSKQPKLTSSATIGQMEMSGQREFRPVLVLKSAFQHSLGVTSIEGHATLTEDNDLDGPMTEKHSGHSSESSLGHLDFLPYLALWVNDGV